MVYLPLIFTSTPEVESPSSSSRQTSTGTCLFNKNLSGSAMLWFAFFFTN